MITFFMQTICMKDFYQKTCYCICKPVYIYEHKHKRKLKGENNALPKNDIYMKLNMLNSIFWSFVLTLFWTKDSLEWAFLSENTQSCKPDFIYRNNILHRVEFRNIKAEVVSGAVNNLLQIKFVSSVWVTNGCCQNIVWIVVLLCEDVALNEYV